MARICNFFYLICLFNSAKENMRFLPSVLFTYDFVVVVLPLILSFDFFLSSGARVCVCIFGLLLSFLNFNIN